MHADKRRIGSWILDPRKPGDRYIVHLASGADLELRSLREAFVFVNGLASAAQAIEAEVMQKRTPQASTISAHELWTGKKED
jgi:hypothetical protein